MLHARKAASFVLRRAPSVFSAWPHSGRIVGRACPASVRSMTAVAEPAPSRGHSIVTYPAPGLRATCAAVAAPSTPEMRACVDNLLQHARATDCMGLAAPQLGYAVRAFVMRKPLHWTEAAAAAAQRAAHAAARRGNGRRGRGSSRAPEAASFVACINPRIVSHSEDSAIGIESCLSVPDHIALVRRPLRVSVEYVNGETGVQEAHDLTGLPAVVFCHELDHLDGVLLLDRELRVFTQRSEDDELQAANERWMLQLMMYYGMPPAAPTSPPPGWEG